MLDNMDFYLGYPIDWDTSQTVWRNNWKRRLMISEGHSIQQLIKTCTNFGWATVKIRTTADAMLSIFRNVRFRSIIDSSQTKGLWRKKYISKVVLRKSFITEERSILIAWELCIERSTLRKRKMFCSVHFILTNRIMWVNRLKKRKKHACASIA